MSKAILIGSPNSGKSLLFNRLTGLHQKVANFPGITVEVSSGKMVNLPEVVLVDYPGSYSLHAISGEENIAVENFEQALVDPELAVVLCLIDATRIEKGLYFATQVVRACQQHNKHVILLASMMDVLRNHNISLDIASIASELNTPVIGISGKSGEGLDALVEKVANIAATYQEEASFPAKSLAKHDDAGLREISHRIAKEFGPKGDILVKSQARLDSFFLHTWFGGAAFFLIMYLLFQSIFTWAAPAMDLVESIIGNLADIVIPIVPTQTLQDFVSDALFGGIGAFLVFVPQIFVLTVVVGILEDSGYMARAAVICHKPLRFFGLTGKSFIPMLSGVACAIPAIYAARSVDSPRARFLTYMAIPLMPCSARLPVYTLLIAAFIPANFALGGLLGLQGLAMFGIYLFGMLTGLLVTAFVSRVSSDTQDELPFVLEMPPYRLPSWQPLLRNAWNRSKHFITKAGAIIFTVTVVIWFLGYFPNFGEDLGASYLGSIGKVIEPVFSPIGLDWRYGVAILSSFLAREVFVGTLGAMFGIEGAADNFVPLAERIQDTGLSLGSGFALLVFFAIALQCVSTLAILSKESGSIKLPVQLFTAYSILAYLLSLLTYHLVEFLV